MEKEPFIVYIEIDSPEEMNIFARRLADLENKKVSSFGYAITQCQAIHNDEPAYIENKLPAIFKLILHDNKITIYSCDREKLDANIALFKKKSVYNKWIEELHGHNMGMFLLSSEYEKPKAKQPDLEGPQCSEEVRLLMLGEAEKNHHKEYNTDGGSTDYYDIEGCKDVDDICQKLELTFAEGNILKALFGRAKARKGHTRHGGTNITRDTNKILHYAKKLHEEL